MSSTGSNLQFFDSSCDSILDSQQMVDFIDSNRHGDPATIRLKYSGKQLPFDLDFALVQIQCRRKCSRKLPFYISFPEFFFPSDIASQQASHQDIAHYNATVMGCGKRILDLTAGLGIDAMEAARAGNRVTAIEIDSWKCEVLRHNARITGLSAGNMEVVCSESETYLIEESENHYDVIYIDPARRGRDSQRTHSFQDCSPDITRMMPLMLSKADRVIVKASPLLDIARIIEDFPQTRKISAVSWRGECKELLIELSERGDDPIEIEAINLLGERGMTRFCGTREENRLLNVRYLTPQGLRDEINRSGEYYLYEPDASMMKTGLWGELQENFPDLKKADTNTHLFFSNLRHEDFPGRRVRIVQEINGKERKRLKGERINVVCRNFPQSAEEMRRHFSTSEGDSAFLYCFRMGKERVILRGEEEKDSNSQQNITEMAKTLMTTDFNFKGQKSVYHGKVRDVYDIDDRLLVMVATDRISAFDVILPEGIPFKGQVLNQIAARFLDATSDIVPNWKVATPDPMVTVGIKCQPMKVEMIVRGYLAGSAWREYAAGARSICGVELPDGLKENQKLPHPILTPTTKADEGHDENISREEIISRGIVAKEDYEKVEKYALALFQRGTEMAARQGLILVDTKYEFGLHNGEVILIDEIHTPDSSRYFYAEGYEERLEKGEEQRQLSKEFVRRWLIENGFMGKEGQKVPEMTPEYCKEVSDRYIELFEKITGEKFIKGDTDNLSDRIEKNVAEALKTL